jgi:hypothetical protein
MSKSSRRPNREEIKDQRRNKKRQEKALRERQKAAGLIPRTPPALPNTCSSYATVEEEQQAREEAVTGQLRILRRELPKLLQQLAKIHDSRDPKKRKHKLTILLLYGLLTFVFQFSSRREVNREMTRPQFMENLQLLFPELEKLPHADTLFRLLQDIDVEHIVQAHIDLVRRLIRNKKFHRFLINNCYPIAIDGSQKLAKDILWDENPLERTFGKGENSHTQYYVYVLEASLSFRNGMVIPLLSEFLEYAKGDTSNDKQDSEQRAFHRLSTRLKQFFSHLPIILLLDGLYANGPVMERCRALNWQCMIVLKDKDLSTVWEEYNGLKPLLPKNQLNNIWGDRRQHFSWVNDIEYEYLKAGKRNYMNLHVVVCEESWEEVGNEGEIVPKTARHAWISSRPLNHNNVHERCNLGARYRWGIEAGFLVEKHQGYQYEHAFALDWNAMKGYHYLMRLAHLFNTLARFSQHLKTLYAQFGVRGAIAFIRQSCAAPWLDPERIKTLLNCHFQLKIE